MLLELCLLTLTCKPTPEHTVPRAPVVRAPRIHVDKFTLFHAAGATYDGATTLRYISGCPRNLTCGEANPVARVLIGRTPHPARTLLVGAAVVVGVSMIPNTRIRHVLQTVLGAEHTAAGTSNLLRGYR